MQTKKPKLYPGGGYSLIRPGIYVKTGEFRAPKKGEYYLSGAIPEAYKAHAALDTSYHIMRPATKEETICECCEQKRKVGE